MKDEGWKGVLFPVGLTDWCTDIRNCRVTFAAIKIKSVKLSHTWFINLCKNGLYPSPFLKLVKIGSPSCRKNTHFLSKYFYLKASLNPLVKNNDIFCTRLWDHGQLLSLWMFRMISFLGPCLYQTVLRDNMGKRWLLQ